MSSSTPAAPGRRASLVVAVIGALTLVAVLLVAVLTSDDLAGGSALPGAGNPGSAIPGATTGSGGSAGPGGGGGGAGASSPVVGPSAPAVPAAHLSIGYLRTHIPLPAGSRKVGADQKLGSQLVMTYQVPLSLAGITAYYTTRLPALGLRYSSLGCSAKACGARMQVGNSSTHVGELQFNDLTGNQPKGTSTLDIYLSGPQQ